MEPTEFKVGVKFKLGESYQNKKYAHEIGIENEVIRIGVDFVVTKNGTHIGLDSNYAKHCTLISEPEKLYSKSEVETIREASFNAAKEFEQTADDEGRMLFRDIYETFEDYQKDNPLT